MNTIKPFKDYPHKEREELRDGLYRYGVIENGKITMEVVDVNLESAYKKLFNLHPDTEIIMRRTYLVGFDDAYYVREKDSYRHTAFFTRFYQ